MTNFTVDVSQIVLFIGVMAFIVSIITEALKKWMVLCQDLVQVKMRNFYPF